MGLTSGHALVDGLPQEHGWSRAGCGGQIPALLGQAFQEALRPRPLRSWLLSAWPSPETGSCWRGFCFGSSRRPWGRQSRLCTRLGCVCCCCLFLHLFPKSAAQLWGEALTQAGGPLFPGLPCVLGADDSPRGPE